MHKLLPLWLKGIHPFRRPAEKGQGLVEYALILVLVAVVAIAILLALGPAVRQVYANVVCSLDLGSDLIRSTRQGAPPVLTLNIYVRRPTTITISGDGSGGGACNPDSCTYTVSGLPAHGTLKIEATQGMCYVTHTW